MTIFNRMKTSWFPPQGVSERPMRRYPPKVEPTVDEATARAAEQLLENGAFDRVMRGLEGAAYQEFSTAATPEQLGGIHARVRALEDIKNQIQAMADGLKLLKPHNAED